MAHAARGAGDQRNLSLQPHTCPPVDAASFLDPGIAGGVLAGVVGVEIDEAALDLPVADLEHVAPAAGAPFRHAGAPRPVLVLAMAGAFADDDVAAGEDPVEVANSGGRSTSACRRHRRSTGRSAPCRWRVPISGNRPARPRRRGRGSSRRSRSPRHCRTPSDIRSRPTCAARRSSSVSSVPSRIPPECCRSERPRLSAAARDCAALAAR